MRHPSMWEARCTVLNSQNTNANDNHQPPSVELSFSWGKLSGNLSKLTSPLASLPSNDRAGRTLFSTTDHDQVWLLSGDKEKYHSTFLQHSVSGQQSLALHSREEDSRWPNAIPAEMDYEALKEQWSEVEDRDGVRLSWNVFPSSRMVGSSK